MYQGSCFCYGNISTKLLCYHAGDMCHLNRVLKHILPIACAEVQPTYDGNYPRIKIKYSAFVYSLLTFFLYYFVYFFLCFLNKLLYFCRLYTAIKYKVLKCQPGYLATDGIKRGNDNGSWGIVHYKFHPRSSFKCSNIPSFLSYNFSFYLIVGYRYYGRH